MKINRTMKIGLAIIGLALLLILVVSIFSKLRSGLGPNTTVTQTPPDVVPTEETQPVAMTGGTVYVSQQDIPERTILTSGMFSPQQINGPTDGYVTSLTGLEGFVTRVPIPHNNRLRHNYLLGHISDVGIAGTIRPGLRAMSITITNRPTLHDLVKIGDYVDVISSFDAQESRVIVQNVRVLAVDVFGRDYPQISAAVRNEYRAAPGGITTANPGSPAPAPAPANPPVAPAPGEPGQPAPAPTNTPTPMPDAGPRPKPEASLTLEVTPRQAVAISLAQSSGTNLDFVLRPHETSLFASGAGADGATDPDIAEPPPAASITRTALAPYAEAIKRPRPAPVTRERGPSNNSNPGPPPDFGHTGGTTSLPPVLPPFRPTPIPTPIPPTYDIPVYADGTLTRTDTVRNPAASAQLSAR